MVHGDEGSDKKKLFYTTSDMMKTMNKALSDMDSPDDDMNPRVELQRRMPDGTTRRADDKDLEAADMDSKLKQVRGMAFSGIVEATDIFFSHNILFGPPPSFKRLRRKWRI
jgi:hypothetical protein